MLAEEADTIEDVYEPFLLRLGFLDRTPQGRIATEAARAHLAGLGFEIPAPRRAEPDMPALWDDLAGPLTMDGLQAIGFALVVLGIVIAVVGLVDAPGPPDPRPRPSPRGSRDPDGQRDDLHPARRRCSLVSVVASVVLGLLNRR